MQPRAITGFDRSQVPTIACINQATVPLGVDFDKLVAALQKFTDRCFAPVWGTPAKLVAATKIPADAWAIVFLDDADVADALGYHDLTPDGFPLSKVFVKTILQSKEKVSVTACHELCEMLVDPATNLCCAGPGGVIYAYETADAVEEEEFLLDGIAMSNFVYPSWFEEFRKPGSAQFDYLNNVRKPFQIMKGGYMPVFKNGKWTTIHGSVAKAKRHAKEDRRGHRPEIRSQKHAS